MNKIDVRKNKILNMLNDRGSLTVNEIAETFNISLPTVRRMCINLEKEHLVSRSHGRISLVTDAQVQYSFSMSSQEYVDEKKRIAEYCSRLIQNNQTIFLESGTTVYQCALSIAARIQEGVLNDVIVMTNSLLNLNVLQPFCTVILIGGIFRPERQDFAGYFCERMIRNLSFDHCFVGSDAISLSDGIMAFDSDTCRLDELLISRSAKTYVVSTFDKFSRHSLISYASVKDVSAIITDSRLPAEVQTEFINAEANIICV